MILCVGCTQIDPEEWKQFLGLHFGSPHVAQPPYMPELTWLTIESCYHIWKQEWYELIDMWTVTH